MSVTVTVRGAFSVLRPPERATIFFAVSVERPHQQAAYAAAADSASIVSGRLLEQLDPERGPVTSWSSDQVRTWASRPWNNEGTQLPPVHHAQVNFQATFSDFGRLSDWVGSTSEVVGLTIDRVEWSLSEANRDTLTREVRVAAVRDARDKAQTYADALSLGVVRVVAVADQGMLRGGDGVPGPAEPLRLARASMSAADPQITFEPQDVAVSAVVDARFEID